MKKALFLITVGVAINAILVPCLANDKDTKIDLDGVDKREKAGKIQSFQMFRSFETVDLDFVASTLTGEVSNVYDEGIVGIIHKITVSIDGDNYYPEKEEVRDRAYDWPAGRDFSEKLDEVICRANEHKQFTICLPDNPKTKKGKYKYTITYEATTPEGGICNWKFTEKQN